VTNSSGTVVAEQNLDAWGRNRQPNTWNYGVLPVNPTWLYRGYTGHEQLNEFNLINMNARLYDPTVGRMLSPDNYVSVGGSQGLNRYTYANNNPLKYTDPDGNFWHIAIGAGIGGLVNGFMHIDKPGGFWKGFAIGAVAGALTAATGGLAAGYYATGTAAGAWVGATTGIYSSGVIGGAISGTAGAVVGSPVLGLSNNIAFGDPYSGKTFLRDVLVAGGLGGILGGIAAKFQGNNIWSNAPQAAGTTAWTSPNVNKDLLSQQGFIRLSDGKWLQVKDFGLGRATGGQLIRDINPETISEFLENANLYNGNKNGYISYDVVQRSFDEMVNGTFDPVKNAVSGFVDKGHYIINDGNHRIVAATWYGLKTSNYNILESLIKNGNFAEGNYYISKSFFPLIWSR
jgi:RHS repeat-associated protein